MEPAFECDGIRKIDRNSLIFKKEIQSGVDVVQLEDDGRTYVHKYMRPYSIHTPFAIEAANYSKVDGSTYVPELIAIVTLNDENRGLLISEVKGETLSDLELTSEEKWTVTSKLLIALVDLVSRSYFPHLDLCSASRSAVSHLHARRIAKHGSDRPILYMQIVKPCPTFRASIHRATTRIPLM